MSDHEFQKHLSMIQTMTLDCQTGGITKETYISNLSMVVENLKESPAIDPANNIGHVMEFIEEKRLLDELQHWMSGPLPEGAE